MARNIQAFAEVDSNEPAAVVAEPVTTVNADPGLISARIKGTWRMYWGSRFYDFEDGKRYMIPRDLFAYLKSHSNIYDTL